MNSAKDILLARLYLASPVGSAKDMLGAFSMSRMSATKSCIGGIAALRPLGYWTWSRLHLAASAVAALWLHTLSVADILWRVRLKHMPTLEYYLQEVAALPALSEAPPDAKLRVSYATSLFQFFTSSSL